MACFYAVLSAGGGFLYDDRQLILDEIVPRSAGDFARAFTEPYYGVLPYYRPLTRLTYLTQKAIGGTNPAGFLAVNAALAGLLVVAVYALLRRVRFGMAHLPALFVAVAFAILPVASSCVFPIAGRDTLLPTVLIVGALACWLSDTPSLRVVSYTLVAAALLAKEVAIAAPLIALAADATTAAPPRGTRAWLARHAPFAAIVGVYLATRHIVLAGAERPALARSFALPFASLAYGAQAILMPRINLVYEPSLSTWLSIPRVALALAALCALFWAARHAEEPGGPRNATFWIAWFVSMQLPTANLVRQETLFDERYAFPAALAPLALAACVATAASRGRSARAIVRAGALIVLAASAAIDVNRATIFASELTFSQAWTRRSPGSAGAWNSLGVSLLQAGRRTEGEDALRLALAADGNHAQAANNLGTTLLERGAVEDAAAYLEMAVAQSPSYAVARYNLANARGRAGRDAEAEALYRDAIRLRPHYVRAWNNLGALLVRTGREDEALAAFERVVMLDPTHEKAQVNRGVLLARRGRFQEAMAAYRAALAIDPADADAHFDLGAAALAAGDRETALRALDDALRLRPGWPKAQALRERASIP